MENPRYMLSLKKFSCLALLYILPVSAWAHTDHGIADFSAGLLHPWNGLDHLLTAIAIGLFAAGRKERTSWEIPFAFLLIMSCGYFLGRGGLAVPLREHGILLSLIFMGAALLQGVGPGSWWKLTAVACFGLFHGNAHGVEMNPGSQTLAPALGLFVSTLALHLLGMAAAKGVEILWSPRLASLALRCFGAAMIGSIFLT